MKKALLFSLFTLITPISSLMADTQKGSSNKLKVLDDGILALDERIQMIKSARHTIEVEYFIYSIDPVGRIFTQALLEKAKEGVKIRILVDSSAPIFELKPYYALAIRNELPEDKKDNIQIKYFNPAPLLKFYTSQFRNHRKLLVIDDEVAMTGGRNIADEYFDLNPEYNFLDRDVVVRGPLAKEMRETFDLFWSAKMSKPPKFPKKPVRSDYDCHPADDHCDDFKADNDFKYDTLQFNKKLGNAQSFITATVEDKNLLEKISGEAKRIDLANTEQTCQETFFYTDTPGKKKRNQLIKNEIAELIANTTENITVESPYFVLYSKTHNEMSQVLEKGVKLRLLTNSLYSTDAIYVAAVFNAMAGTYVQEGMDAYIYKGGHPVEWGGVSEEAKEGIWGIHSKSATFDNKHTFIGTYNVDPRSRNLNFEMGIVCKNNPEIASLVTKRIETRIENAVKLNENGKPEDGSRLLFDAPFGKRVLYWGLMIPSHIFKLLL